MTLLASPLHRIPTLWALYRPLVRATRTAPLDERERRSLLDYVRGSFKRSRHLTNVERVKREWVEAERLLRQLEQSRKSPIERGRTVELARHLVGRRSRARSRSPRAPPPPSPPRSARPTILHATQFAPPMLRLRPQPLETSMMIFNRRRKSQQRFDKLDLAREYVDLVREEDKFERRIIGVENRDNAKWGHEWVEWMTEAREKEKREHARNNMRIPDVLYARAARLNRQRESQRKKVAAAEEARRRP